MKNRFNKLLALLLAVVMVVGILPAGIIAVGADDSGEIVVIACSDFQDPADQGKSAATTGSARVKAILAQIEADHPDADGFICCGDYDKKLPSSSVSGSIASLKSAVNSVYASLKNFFLVQGNHDQVDQGSNSLTGSGAHDTDDYGVFIIDEDDYQWSSGVNESRIKKTAENLKAYFAAKDPATWNKPIFVLSHVPLHFSSRTYCDGDGAYAKYIFDELQAAGEAGFTVIFLHGHDHSQGFDNYLGGAVDFLPVGHEFYLAVPPSSNTKANRTKYTVETLKFTYMNAGYIGYYADYEPGSDKNSGVDKTLTMSVFTITDKGVTVERYSENGIYKNLKSAGCGSLQHATDESNLLRVNADNTTTKVFAPFTDVVTCPQTITLPVPADPDITDTADGVTVTAKGLAGLTVSHAAGTETIPGVNSYIAYQISAEFTGNFATVEIPLPAGYTADRTKVYYRAPDGSRTDMLATIANGKAVFKTTHFSEYDLTLGDAPELTDWAEVIIPGATIHKYVLDTDGIDNGERYMILAPSNDVALVKGSTDPKTVTVTNNNTITMDNTNSDWVATVTSSYNESKQSLSFSYNTTLSLDNPTNYYIKVGNNYYQVTQASCKRSGKSGKFSYSWTVKYKGGTETYSTQEITLYTISTVVTLKNGTQYVYSSGNSNLDTTKTSATQWNVSVQSDGRIRLSNSDKYFIRYYNSSWGMSNNTSSSALAYRNLRWFKYTPETTEADQYYLRMTNVGDQTFSTKTFADQNALETYLRTLITVYKADDKNGTNQTTVSYRLTPDNTVNPTVEGTMTYTVLYGEHKVGSFKVSFVEKKPVGLAFEGSGSVYRASKDTTIVSGTTLTVTYDDDSTEIVPLTLAMVNATEQQKKTADTYEGLTITYGGLSVSDYVLTVLPRPEENDYPEYPEGGSVRVGKSGQGIDFPSTGIANIELSAAGIPMSKGVDVIVMVDTSSSMKYGAQDGTDTADAGSQRIDYLRNSLTAMFEKFSKPNEDGSAPDIRVALADFNGYRTNGAYPIEKHDSFGSDQTRQNLGQVFTGDKTISAGAFEQVGSYTSSQISTLVKEVQAQSGTNFDYAFDTIYRLGTAIKAQNEANDEDRDLFVIFMSDGCPYSFNYATGGSTSTDWAKWLTGGFTSAGKNHPDFYNAETQNTHRMADAIKGSADDSFVVIDPTKSMGEDYGKSEDAYMRVVPGLGATMYAIGFCVYADNSIKADTIRTVISRVASDSDHYFEVQGTDQDGNVQARLDKAFTQISQNIRLAAENARFIDTLGSEYDLQLPVFNYKVDNADKTVDTAIRILRYPIYKSADVGNTIGGHLVTEEDVGKRYGEPTVMETVTYSNGAVYSSELGSTNIMSDVTINHVKRGGNLVDVPTGGLISAKYFWYNNDTENSVMIDANGDEADGAEYELAPETFYWKIGKISDEEFVMSYYVYLTDSMEGGRPEGSYPTNEEAVLRYRNLIEHEVHKDTVSPILPWGAANVSYAFYLVDENGNPVTSRTSGKTGTFANKVAVTDPVIYQTILLNSTGSTIDATEIFALDILPEGYKLYDTEAAYEIGVNSNGDGYWTITKGADVNNAVYVTGYAGSDYSNSLTSRNADGVDYSHTTVWFPVLYTIKAIPDTVVVDYGRPVEIHPLVNDMFGNNGRLIAIGLLEDMPSNMFGEALNGDFAAKLSFDAAAGLKYGSAAIKINNNDATLSTVTYDLSTMQMTDAEVFAYAVQYTNSDYPANNGVYYGTITVIPATIIYYEDTENFITYEGDWVKTDTADKMQGEDRPGAYSLAQIDADNIYGFDPMNKTYTADSLGGSHKVTVGEGDTPTATFTFTGTGFDIISRTDTTTGAILVDVKGENDFDKTWVVDTFYGMKMNLDGYIRYVWEYDGELWHADGELVTEKGTDESKAPEDPEEGDTFIAYEPNYQWEPDSNADTLYQIPVIKSETLDYGTYTVTIRPYYHAYFDHTGEESYDFYLDAIRIYEPAKGSETAEAAYLQDHEAFPEFIEIRNELITAAKAGDLELDENKDKKINGALFIDAFGTYTGASVYAEFGPNNEVYLKPGQAISFIVDGTDVDKVHVSAKAVNTAVTLQVMLGETVSKSIAINTSTDMYYDITDTVNGESKTITLKNTGSGILSLTNLKITHTSAPAALQSAPPTKLYMTAGAAAAVSGQIRDAYVAANTKVTFKPAELKVKAARSTVTRGETVTMTVTTSYDVAAVKVNGLGASLVCSDRATGEKVWTFSAPALIDGTYPASVVALNGAGVESAAVVKNVTVYGNGEMNALKGARNAMNGRFTAVQLDEAV